MIILKLPNHIQIFIDASKLVHNVSFAVVLSQTFIQHKQPVITSIFTAENYAIFEAIKLSNSLKQPTYLSSATVLAS